MRALQSLFAALIIFPVPVYAQLGGSGTYAFMNLTSSARTAALGGTVVSVWDDDLNLPFNNPGLLNPAMSKHLVISYVNYFTDINYGYVSYAEEVKKLGTFAAGIHYINYGDFIAADRYGTISGEFTASEYTINLLWARSIDSLFHIGLDLKPVFSVLERYRSFGLAADIGLSYHSPDGLFCTGLSMRNIGMQIRAYHSKNREPVPCRIELGVSQKLSHAPFRFSVVAHNLQKFDLTYINSNKGSAINTLTGGSSDQTWLEDYADKLMRHLIFGVEFIPLEAFQVRVGYNYMRRQELKLDTRVAMVGFSWGFGLKVSGFRISYGRASYHLAGASNHFSLSTDLSYFTRKRGGQG
jgi:hypothetical protein